ncbi:MAG: DUF5652 family protein [Patescibacteria group bacterium]|jgi:methionyl-tRNA synthetase
MEQFLTTYPWVIWLALIWTLPWKGVALWKSARANQLPWFVALMVINTLGLLEIIYIFAVRPKAKK